MCSCNSLWEWENSDCVLLRIHENAKGWEKQTWYSYTRTLVVHHITELINVRPNIFVPRKYNLYKIKPNTHLIHSFICIGSFYACIYICVWLVFRQVSNKFSPTKQLNIIKKRSVRAVSRAMRVIWKSITHTQSLHCAAKQTTRWRLRQMYAVDECVCVCVSIMPLYEFCAVIFTIYRKYLKCSWKFVCFIIASLVRVPLPVSISLIPGCIYI